MVFGAVASQGKMAMVKAMIQRSRGSMQELLDLNALPHTTTSVEEGERLDALRKTAMAKESIVFWALQNGDDDHSRVQLPNWISRSLQKVVSEWTLENAKWNEKIEARGERGLTPANDRKYQEFKVNKGVANLLFSKKSEKQVAKVKDTKELTRKRGEFFSVQVTMSEKPENLEIRIGTGSAQKLVLLRGAPLEEESLPDFLSTAGVAKGVADALADGDDDESENGFSESEAVCQQHREMEEEEKNIVMSDTEEVLILSGDEEDLENLEPVASHCTRVKDFCHRDAFKKLQNQGLTLVPPGAVLSYHKTSCCWQGYFDGRSCGLSSTHGGRLGRSEGESLHFVLRGLAEKYCEKNPRDRLWAAQLGKLNKVGLTVANL